VDWYRKKIQLTEAELMKERHIAFLLGACTALMEK
jgi:hypothetical protein